MRLSGRAVSHTPQPARLSQAAEDKESEPCPLHSHLLKWIERKINKNVIRNPFDTLERQARRRKILGDSRMIPHQPRKSDNLSEFLRREHKVDPAGLNILRLPKRPFGCHSTYNGEENFVKTHVVSRDASPAQAEELDSLVRLYRLAEKRQQRKVKYSPPSHQSPLRAEYDTYEGESGILVCPQNKRFLEAYENDRVMYKGMMEQAFRLTKQEPKKSETQHQRNRSTASPARLYPNPPSRTSRLSESLSQKYSKLFDGPPDVTSFRL